MPRPARPQVSSAQALTLSTALAADGIPSEVSAWLPVQQLYTRLDEANHLATQFKEKINEAVQQGEHAV